MRDWNKMQKTEAEVKFALVVSKNSYEHLPQNYMDLV